jgi:3-methyladenine DNA glycosylase AlkD
MQTKMARVALERELKEAGTPERAVGAARFFKTGVGDYGEGDVFLGVTTPVGRRIALRYRDLGFKDLELLLQSKVHEYRFVALQILVAQYKGGDEEMREKVVDFYLSHTDCVNNWDLVDASAGGILGMHLKTHPRGVLLRLVASESLWERRIAMIATMTLVRTGETKDALQVAKMLLGDSHDLIHKAVGWVLREVGVADRPALLAFLKKHYERLPRTALRYAIEHFSPEARKKMLMGQFDL